MGKLFGTDGIRGVVNDGLDAMLAFRVGMAAAQVMTREKGGGQPRFTIGKDTRISSDLLEGALIAGLCSAGADVLHLGVIPTPAVAWITVDTKADAGIVISASHNPFEHNGIKIFNGQGFKLSDELEGKIEEILLNDIAVPLKTGGEIGRVIYADEKESQDYIDHLVSTIGSELAGLHILVDCANGAASATAARLFDRFPDLHTDVIHADPDGVNINNGCGSTHLDQLKAMVKAGGYDLGIAFDGDADRCLMVDEAGEEIDGDQVIAACGLALSGRRSYCGHRYEQSGLAPFLQGARHWAVLHQRGRPQRAGEDGGVRLCHWGRAVGAHDFPALRHHRRRPAHRAAIPGSALPLRQESLRAGRGVQTLSPGAHQCAGGR